MLQVPDMVQPRRIKLERQDPTVRWEAFEASDGTVLRWLGMAGFLINTRGTTLMVDPLLGGFDMPVMIEFPIATAELPKLYAVLVTHSNNNHYSVPNLS
jgi:L-ascorbate metabolism protein UlaG (beta-lactamase superfamily)